MTHRGFGASGVMVGAGLLLVLLSGCATAAPATSDVNLGVPTRTVPDRTSIVLEGTGIPAPLAADVVADLRVLANGTGETLNEVADRQRGRDQFRALMSAVEATDSDILVTWGYEDDAEYGAWVLFHEDPPEETLAALRAAPLDVLVETGVDTDQAELDRVSQAVTDSLDDADGITVISASSDVRTATVTVGLIVRDSTVDLESAKRAALERATRVSVDNRLPGPVLFEESPALTDETIPAGLSTTAADGTKLVVGDYVRGGAAMQALVSGVVGVSEQGCITVGGITVVAPLGSGFLDNGRVAFTYLGDYAIGETIDEAGGGYLLYGEGGRTIPAGFEQCGTGEYAVLQP